MTPETLDGPVRAMVERIVPGGTVLDLLVHTERFARKDECFASVEEKVRRDGGERVLGWHIWKGNLIAEAELHAVWKSPDGQLTDIVPRPLFISRILFLPDEKIVYTGATVDNIRINLSGSPVVDDFIRAHSAKFALLNVGQRAYMQEFELSSSEKEVYEFLISMISGIEYMALARRGIDDPCLCRSGKAYRVCHRPQLESALEVLRTNGYFSPSV
ncbi:MAG: SEC-C domain-containing protein [Betaproteobacteria bacterium]|nr:SEC-C domain-containing protein [Betaproteobacteria bacterium]